MNEEHGDNGAESSSGATEDQGVRLAYVVPQTRILNALESEISLGDSISRIWNRKWYVVASTLFFGTAAAVYAFLATEWFRSEVLLAPSQEEAPSSIAAQFTGLASLAGISAGDGNVVEPLAVLRSRQFARKFIEDLNLLPVLFSERWDPQSEQWKDADPEDWPDMREGVKYFHEKILSVRQDDKTNLVTVAVEWTNPEQASEWATALIDRLNEQMRQRALREAQANIDYLQIELQRTQLLTIQQSIGRLMETELQKLMLARGNKEFSFRVIDPAVAPKEKIRPKRLLLMIFGVAFGGFVGLFLAFLSDGRSRARST